MHNMSQSPSHVNRELAHFDAQFLNIHYFKADAKQASSLRGNEPSEIVVMLGGLYRSRLGPKGAGPVIEARPGDILWWPTGTTRIDENDPKHPTYCLALYLDWKQAPVGLPYLIHDHSGIIRILAERLLSLRDYPLPLPPAVTNSYLATILAEFIRQAGLMENSLVAKVARFIEEHMSEPFALNDLARHVGLERHHFGRKYTALTGHSPMHHVRQRRTEHALQMILLDPKRKLKEIAVRIGVRDEYQLRRLLKSHFDLPIRELRKIGKPGVASKTPALTFKNSNLPSPMLACLLGQKRQRPPITTP